MAENGSLMAALLKVQAELPDTKIIKDKQNEQFKRGGKASTYASWDAVIEVVRPVLTRNGVFFTTLPGIGPNGEPTLGYRLIHAETGEALSGEMPLPLARNDLQGLGSGLTYGQRYSLKALLSLPLGDDDDGNAASRRTETKAKSESGNGQPELASEDDVAEIREAAKGLERDQIKLAMAATGLPGSTRADQVPRGKVVAVIKALGLSERATL